jgi:hypothetical protein
MTEEKTTIQIIWELAHEGVLGGELCPTERFWHWPVLTPELLPPLLRGDYELYGEVRWYGELT